MRRLAKKILAWATLAAAVVFYALLLWHGPWWLDGAHIRDTDLQPADGVVITGVRTALVALGAGVVAGIGLYYTHHSHRHAEKLYLHSQEQFEHAREKDRDQAEIAREGQVTDRYVEAIKLLGSDNRTQRLGGIYSLERIMRDSEKDFSTVVKVLAAFIRTQAPVAKPRDTPGLDVQAALTVLARRPLMRNVSIDLSKTYLRKANLAYANLDDWNFRGADLRGANFSYASLERANLSDAYLDDAHFSRAQLIGTWLDVASMKNADLAFAAIDSLPIFSSTLFEARLSSYTTAPTQLPDQFQRMWAERVAECDEKMVFVNEPPPWPGTVPED